ncbi:MAG TPA: NmrA family NAD(P)-binding protein [Candidatus Limnocylindria bacterium]|nr:NmrA family NAD(P)-binding protein [Candidatus Limnocylindria bacterium]
MIAIAGATGNTGRPAAEALLAKGEKVRAIGRDAKKLDALVQKGAEAFVGNVEDATSMIKAFEGATAAYLAIPGMRGEGLRAYQEKITDAYAAAIAQARVPYAVTLSSLGAQHPEKTGPIVGLYNMEHKLNGISGLNVLHLRPAQFMENLFMSITPLRSMGILPGSSPGDAEQPWIATKDIGTYAAERLQARDFSGSSTQDLLGPRDYTMKEVASIIGKAIGKPNLGYMQVPFMMLEPALVQMGIPKSTAALVIEMWKAMNDGLLARQEQRSAKNTTPTTLESFVADVFAPTFLSKTASA